MNINEESSRYKKGIKKLKKDHKIHEMEELEKFKLLIYSHSNLQEVKDNPLSKHFSFEKKSGNLSDIYTAHLGSKIRVWVKPIGERPYKLTEIDSVQFVQIDDKHYGDG